MQIQNGVKYQRIAFVIIFTLLALMFIQSVSAVVKTVCVTDGCDYADLGSALQNENGTTNTLNLNDSNAMYFLNGSSRYTFPYTSSLILLNVRGSNVTLDANGSTFYNTGISGLVVSTLNTVPVNNVTIKNFITYNFTVPIRNWNSNNVTVANNVLQEFGTIGVQIRNGTGLLIEGNVINSSVTAANGISTLVRGAFHSQIVRNNISIKSIGFFDNLTTKGLYSEYNNFTDNFFSNGGVSSVYMYSVANNFWLNHLGNGIRIFNENQSFCVNNQGNFWESTLTPRPQANQSYNNALEGVVYNSSVNDGYFSTALNDGAYVDEWYNTNAMPVWFAVNLSSQVNVSKVVVVWYNGYRSSNWTLQYSTDYVTWTDYNTSLNGSAFLANNSYCVNNCVPQTINNINKAAKYWRAMIYANDSEFELAGVDAFEFEVFGQPAYFNGDCGAVNITLPDSGRYTEDINITWKKVDANRTVNYTLQYSTDGGATWLHLATTTVLSYLWSITNLADNLATYIVRIIPSDYFFNATSDQSTQNFTIINNEFVCSNATLCEYQDISSALVGENGTTGRIILLDPNTNYEVNMSRRFTSTIAGNNDIYIVINISNITLDLNNSALYTSDDTSGNGFAISLLSVYNVTVKNGNISGFGGGINISNGFNVTFDNVLFMHNSYGSLMTIEGSNNINISNSVFYNVSGSRALLMNLAAVSALGRNSNNVAITNSNFSLSAQPLIDADNNSGEVTITNLTIRNSHFSNAANCVASTAEYLVFVNNTCKYTTTGGAPYGLKSDNMSNGIIADNTFFTNSIHLLVYRLRNSTINNNVFNYSQLQTVSGLP
ncbi:discoidin domain-containing protein, partial [Candidatus Woesearchaeota archaeon]|nr:discoidin domain-containing protein [Candidatus Woesearchaeota archaeon]